MAEPVWESLVQLLTDLAKFVGNLAQLAFSWSLLIAWIAWWLRAVNWRKTWQVLAQGAWVVVVLLMVTTALVWSRVAPSDCSCLGFVTIPNLWWQLGGISLLVAVTLFCGWLQGALGWTPSEIELEPPPSHEHNHGHS